MRGVRCRAYGSGSWGFSRPGVKGSGFRRLGVLGFGKGLAFRRLWVLRVWGEGFRVQEVVGFEGLRSKAWGSGGFVVLGCGRKGSRGWQVLGFGVLKVQGLRFWDLA